MILTHNLFAFPKKGLAKWLPQFFLWLVNIRLRSMWLEDLEIQDTRTKSGGFTGKTCGPKLQSLTNELNQFDGVIDQGRLGGGVR